MIQITLIRHGIAEDEIKDISDFDRALTDEGCQKLLKRLLKHREPLSTIDRIVCSPSLRTRQTCALLCSVIDIPTENIIYDKHLYMFDNNYQILYNLVNMHIYDNHHICLVGHNHSISDFASYLAGEEIVMKKGEIKTFSISNITNVFG